MKFNIAIVGATGLTGRKAIDIIVERNLTCHNYTLFASKKHANKKIKFGKVKLPIFELNKENLLKQKFDFALFCVKEDLSKKFVKLLARQGTKVIDFSSAYRKAYPLVVPEINFDSILGSNIICNPNCSTAQSVIALNKINEQFGLDSIVYSTYQAVSGAGKLAISDFNKQSKSRLKKLDFPIRNNFIPYIGSIDAHGYSTEENKMIFETKKILNLTDTKIISTCIRIPVKNCHGVSIVFTTKKKATLAQIADALSNSPGLTFVETMPPMPMLANGQDNVYAGRLKQHKSIKNCFSIMTCADNLRKGASLNAVQILQKLIEVKNGI